MDRGRRCKDAGLRALVAAALCAAVLPAGRAAAAATPGAVTQAEQGTITGWGVKKLPDASADGGSALQYDSGGSVRLKVKLPADADGVTLRMRGDQCAGAPAYTATIDNLKAGSGTVAGTSWAEQTVS